LSVDLAYLMGLLVGDGSLTYKNYLDFTNVDFISALELVLASINYAMMPVKQNW
jgi:hypothetical protein